VSPWGKLTALACHPTKKVNKADDIIYYSKNIDGYDMGGTSNQSILQIKWVGCHAPLALSGINLACYAYLEVFGAYL